MDIVFDTTHSFNYLVDKGCFLMKLFINLDFKNEPIFALINLVLYILLIIVIYQIFLKITEHSPLFETVTMSLLTIIIINSLRYGYLLGKFIGENNEFRQNVKQSFNYLREDIKEIKKK